MPYPWEAGELRSDVSGMHDKSTNYCAFFGGFRIYDAGGEEVPLPVAKGAAILAYLAISKHNSVDRGVLTGLLWSERPEVTARTALRQCLYQLKSVLSRLNEDVLKITPQTITLDRSKLECDLNILFDPERSLSTNLIERADPATILRGLDNLDPAFSEWVSFLRSDIEQRLHAHLTTVIKTPSVHPKLILSAAEHLLRLDPAQEVAARALIEHAAKNGDVVSLLRTYRKFWNALEDEWGEEPTVDLQNFVGETRVRLGDTSDGKGQPSAGRSVGKYMTVLSVRSCVGRDAVVSLSPQLLAEARKVIEVEGGVVLQASEHGLDCVFGLPLPSEFDAHKALEAALTLRDLALSDFETPTSIGIESGIVFVSSPAGGQASVEAVGHAFDRAVVLAQGRTTPKVLVSKRTIRMFHHLYDLRPLESQNSRRLHEDIEADEMSTVVEVLNSLEPNRVNELSGRRSTFIGRAPFLAAMRAVWAEVQSDRALHVVSIQGVAGVGKTRLADELLEELRERGIHTARMVCDRTHRNAPFAPALRLIRSFEDQRQSAAPFPHENDGKAQAPGDTSQGLIEAIGDAPSAFLVDDWQWAEDTTRATLGRFITRAAHLPVLVILTSRETPVDDWLLATSQQVMLPNMTAREVEDKATRLLKQPMERRLRHGLFAKSGGNPLFLEEICHSLAQAVVSLRPEALVNSLPANMQSLIASRIERLSPEDIEIVKAASVHGDQVEVSLLAEIIGRNISSETIDRLASLDIMNPVHNLQDRQEGINLRFKHGVARDVAYSLVAPEKLQSLHLAFARVLRARVMPEHENQFAEVFAMHFSGGGDLANAVHFSEISGDRALVASSLDQAMWHYENALNTIERMPRDTALQKRWVSLARRWAIPCVYAASVNQLETLERAVTLAEQIGDMRAAAWALYWVGYVNFVLGENETALTCMGDALNGAKKCGDARLVAEVRAIEGCVLGSVAQYKQAQERMVSAIQAKEQHPSKGDKIPVTSNYTRANLALALADQGKFEEADELIRVALERVKDANHEVESSILNFAAATHLMRRNWETALDYGMRSRERSEKVSSAYLMGMSRCIWGFSHWKLHGGTEGLDILSNSARWMDAKGMRLYLSLMSGWHAEALLESHRYDEAIRASDVALDRAASGEIIGGSMACRAGAHAAIIKGDLALATKRLEAAQDFAKRRLSSHDLGANHLLAARLQHAHGNIDVSRDEVSKARNVFAQPELHRWLDVVKEVEADLL